MIHTQETAKDNESLYSGVYKDYKRACCKVGCIPVACFPWLFFLPGYHNQLLHPVLFLLHSSHSSAIPVLLLNGFLFQSVHLAFQSFLHPLSAKQRNCSY